MAKDRPTCINKIKGQKIYCIFYERSTVGKMYA